MKEGFRQAMAWLHTWAGLIFGWLLFAIFLTGTMSYFKPEITRWSQPEVPVRALDTAASLAKAQDYLQRNAADAPSWFIQLPDERTPGIGVGWRGGDGPRGFTRKTLDAQTGEEITARDSRGGEFFYRFHFELEMPYPWGRWLASFAALMMLVGLVTGIITHKKIFKEFFTFRPDKGQRSWLDGHNAIGVLVLPFHLMISYSSLVIFMYMVMPASILASYGSDQEAFFNDVFSPREKVQASGQKVPLPALPELYAKVLEQAPPATKVIWVDVQRPGDSTAQVLLIPDGHERVAIQRGAGWRYDVADGSLIWRARPDTVPAVIGGGFYGLHMASFAGPLLRWLYFFFGLAGTAVIGTGLVMWLGKRQLKHAKSGVQPFELRLVEVLNIASMSGLILAVAGFFWANRLLPVALEGRSDWEINVFFGVWLTALLHAALRKGRRAWGEQLALAAVLWAGLPLLNAITTGQGLNHSILAGDWAMAGFDLTALGCGLFFAWTAGKMLRPPVQAAKRAPKPAKAAPALNTEAEAS